LNSHSPAINAAATAAVAPVTFRRAVRDDDADEAR
jgi:hypothetical protein